MCTAKSAKMSRYEGRKSPTSEQEVYGDISEEDVAEYNDEGTQENDDGQMMNVEFDLVSENSVMTVHDGEVNECPAQEDNHMMVTESSLAIENVVMHDPVSEIYAGPPLQENDGRNDEMMVAESSLAGENPVIVHDPGIEIHDGPPLQENDDVQSVHIGTSPEIMVYDPDAGPALEDELGGIIIEEQSDENEQVELLVMLVDTTPAIVAEL